MSLILFLILFPVIPALFLLFTKHGIIRDLIVKFSVVVLSVGSIYLLFSNFNLIPDFYNVTVEIMNKAILVLELAMVVFFIYVGFRYKKYWVPVLTILQAAVLIYFEFIYKHPITENITEHRLFFVDYFSIIMALIIGIIGGLICIYALGYMKEYHHHHKEMKDKSGNFFFILFIFLSAMFGIVFSNHLVWMYFFWEVTTLCSFLLIGYSGTEEAKNNAFRALILNLLGGLGFVGGIGYLYFTTGTIELDKMLGMAKAVALIPAIFLGFAGMTKSAQLPFSSWLTGAMVAPTPVSALLHSSTMVKAGVFILIKLSPVFNGTMAGFFVSLVGGVTFLLAAFIAVSQNNAKKVLAYSTISNLGLIVLCAGIGTAAATWAAILLLVFHAIAKALLFLCVGSVEHQIGSRDIEDMDGLVRRMPKMTILLLIGIAGMFLAPFGMLISKWAALKALVDVHPILAVIVAFGSATTLFFWTKWMGKLTTLVHKPENQEKKVSLDEWVPLYLLGIMTIGVCLFFPMLSTSLIDPYISAVYQQIITMSDGNILIMLVMMGLLFLLPIGLTIYLASKKGKNELGYAKPYMSGVNADEPFKYHGSMGKLVDFQTENYYMVSFFGEAKMMKIGVIVSILLIAILFGAGII